MKTCSKCCKSKPLEAFTKNASRKDGLNSACRECHKAYTRRHYEANKAYYVAKGHQHNNAQKAMIQKLKEDTACKDCGVKYPYYCMDFDHLSDKLGNIAQMHGVSRERLLNEILKCDIVCAVCHRKRTHARVAQWIEHQPTKLG